MLHTQEALRHNPGPPYEVVDWISAAVFDNNTIQSNYAARHDVETQGQRLDMTNWATLWLPKMLCSHVNLHALGSDRMRLIFKEGFDKYSIIPLCHPLHPDVVANKLRRWQEAFAQIAADTYLDRPDYQPLHASQLTYRPPIWDRLQAKYDDVEDEVKIFREHPAHRHSHILFCGGDGLAIMRLNFLLARDFRQYLVDPRDDLGSRLPSVIPVQGEAACERASVRACVRSVRSVRACLLCLLTCERANERAARLRTSGEHPHGTCHVLHMGWRPYAPLLVHIMTAIGHNECKADFTVESYNDYDFGMQILITGVAKYFMLLDSRGGAPCPNAMPEALLAHCAQNNDLNWLAHFLYDFGFLYWDMRQAVRCNDSAGIDLIWRECVAFMHSVSSNKTQYAAMAIMRIFWSEAMTPTLARIYHQHRTISLLGLPGSNVGWDMPIEKENLMLRNVVRLTRTLAL